MNNSEKLTLAMSKVASAAEADVHYNVNPPLNAFQKALLYAAMTGGGAMFGANTGAGIAGMKNPFDRQAQSAGAIKGLLGGAAAGGLASLLHNKIYGAHRKSLLKGIDKEQEAYGK